MCGLFGYIGRSPAPETIASALLLLGHRGHDGFGFWCGQQDGQVFSTAEYRQTGVDLPALAQLLPSADHMVFVAHWRYSTRGMASLDNSQPVLVRGGDAAIVHNGQFHFSEMGERAMYSDTRHFARQFEENTRPLQLDDVYAATERLGGAFSLVIACRDGMITVRDRFGIRPFFYGHYAGGIAYSSEIPALTALGCSQIAEVPPGSVALWSAKEMLQCRRMPPAPRATCAFEQIYFHSAKGEFSGIPVWRSRHELGGQLALEAPADAVDIVIGVPKSGLPFASGYAEQSGLPEVAALTARRDSGRTFIRHADIRETVIAGKYRLQPELVRGRAVLLVDDSIVRGATMRHLAAALRAAGARAVHARIGCPQFLHPCFFGVNIPDRSELICHGRTVDEVCRMLGLDSLAFLSTDGLRAVLGPALCLGCFSGAYPAGALNDDPGEVPLHQNVGVRLGPLRNALRPPPPLLGEAGHAGRVPEGSPR